MSLIDEPLDGDEIDAFHNESCLPEEFGRASETYQILAKIGIGLYVFVLVSGVVLWWMNRDLAFLSRRNPLLVHLLIVPVVCNLVSGMLYRNQLNNPDSIFNDCFVGNISFALVMPTLAIPQVVRIMLFNNRVFLHRRIAKDDPTAANASNANVTANRMVGAGSFAEGGSEFDAKSSLPGSPRSPMIRSQVSNTSSNIPPPNLGSVSKMGSNRSNVSSSSPPPGLGLPKRPSRSGEKYNKEGKKNSKHVDIYRGYNSFDDEAGNDNDGDPEVETVPFDSASALSGLSPQTRTNFATSVISEGAVSDELNNLKKKATARYGFKVAILLIVFTAICAIVYSLLNCPSDALANDNCKFANVGGVAGLFIILPLIPCVFIYFYFMKEVRKAPDPFRIKREITNFFYIGYGCGVPMLILSVVDPGGIQAKTPIKFKWLLLVDMVLLVLIINSFHLQVYLARKGSHFNHAFPFSLQQILESEEGLVLFRRHLESEYSSENLTLYQILIKWKEGYPTKRKSRRDTEARNIYRRWIDPFSPGMKVNVGSWLVNQLRDDIIGRKNYRSNLFDDVIRELFKMMESDSFARFAQTNSYKEFVGAQDPKTLRAQDSSDVFEFEENQYNICKCACFGICSCVC